MKLPATRNQRIAAALTALVLIVAFAGVYQWRNLQGAIQPPPTEKLTIATSAYLGSGLVHLAEARGYFAVEGLAVTLQKHTSGRNALAAVIDNKADIATAGDTPVMFAVARGLHIMIVATIARSVNSHGIIARRDRGISTAMDLRGKTVGALTGTDSHFVLDTILAANGIAAADVSVRNTRSEDLAAALAAGSFDAVSTWEPWLSAARRALGPDGVAINPESGFGFGFHLAGKQDFVRNHPVTMQKLLRAIKRAENFLATEPMAARAILIGSTQSDPDIFDSTWPNFKLRLTLDQRLLSMLEDQARWASASGLIDAKTAPNFLDAIYVDALLSVNPQAVSIVR